jgi:hemoglobin-like flavoprotein
MTTTQIAIVKRTWKIIRSIDPAIVGDAFYSKLFAAHPALRRMFPKDMSQQYQKLMDMLSTIVMRIDHLEDLSKEMEDMAFRHLQYGVKPVHYTFIGEALLWTLEKAMGSGWTDEVKEAWATCYNTIAGAMIHATV